MRDTPGTALAEPLLTEARRYAGGDLPPAGAVAFEQRLATDQAAREALCQAVRLAQAPDGPSALGPDPAYRDEVRRRLLGRTAYRRRPLLWGALGAAAALLLTFGTLGRLPLPPGPPPGPTLATLSRARLPPTPAKMPRLWSGWRHGGHLARCRGGGGPCRHRPGHCPGRAEQRPCRPQQN